MRRLRRSRRRTQVFAVWGALSVGATLFVGCSSGGPPPPPPPKVSPALQPFLVSPTLGFPLALEPVTRQTIEGAFRADLMSGRTVEARSVAAEILARDPSVDPAKLLAAQAWVVEGRYSDAETAVDELLHAFPDYVAAASLGGFLAEEAGDVPLAYDRYSVAGSVVRSAANRAAEIRPIAIESVVASVRSEIERFRFDEAESEIVRLEGWAVEEIVVLELWADLARAADLPEAELEAVRGLDVAADGPRELRERRAELELAIGDPGVAMTIYESLTARFPDDPTLEHQLEAAKFRWRLRNLPTSVQEIERRASLTRADYAVLLYWLAPGVRSRVGEAPRIATDVLDHEHRQEIVRVVNLGLMDLDSGLRRFHPNRLVSQDEAFRSLIALWGRSVPPPACSGPVIGNPRPSNGAVCQVISACGLIDSAEECLPRLEVSGREAIAWIGRASSLAVSGS